MRGEFARRGGGEQAGRRVVVPRRGQMRGAARGRGPAVEGIGRPPVHGRHDLRNRGIEDGLTDDVVPEADHTRAGGQQPRVDAVAERLGDGPLVRAGHRRQQPGGLGDTDHREGEQRVLPGARELLEPGRDHAAHRSRQRERAAAPAGVPSVDHDRPAAQVRVDDLLDEQRNAIGPGQDIGDELAGRRRGEEMPDEVAGRPVAERLEFDDGRHVITAQRADQLIGNGRFGRAERRHDGQAADPRRRQVADRLEAVGIRGVQVVEQQHHSRARPGDVPQQADRGFHGQQAQLPAVQAGLAAGRGLPFGQDQAQPAVEGRPHRGMRVTAEPGPQRLGDQAERRRRRDRGPAGRDTQAGPPGRRGGLVQETALTDPALPGQQRAARPAARASSSARARMSFSASRPTVTVAERTPRPDRMSSSSASAPADVTLPDRRRCQRGAAAADHFRH